MAPLQAASKPAKVTIQLKWKHQFQFAGYYAADHMGYFAAEGLAAQLVEGGPNRDPIREVTEGKATYGIGDSDLLVARAQGLPVVVVAAIFQHSPYVLMTRKADGLMEPKDLVGKRVMVEFNQGEIQAKAMFLRDGIDPSKIIFLPHSWNLKDLIEGRTDAMSGYLGVESYQLERMGTPVTLIRPADHGIDFYGDCLFTTTEEARDHPARVEAVRRAVVKGWTYALDHPEEVSEWILALPGVQERGLRRENMVFEAQAMKALIHSDLVPVGQITQERWERILATYKELGILPASFGLEGFLFEANRLKSARIRNVMILITVITVAVILLFMAWIFLLRRRIQHSTAVLEEREEDYRQLVENTPDCIFVTNGEVFRYLNPAGLQMFEAESGEEILGKLILDFVHPEDRSGMEVSCRRFEESGICIPPEELRMLGRHGRVTPVEVSATPVQFQGEPAARILMRDITEQKRAEQTQKTLLLISEAALSAETLPDLFRRIHEIIAGLLPAKNFFVALYDERKDELTFPYFVDEVDPQPGVMKLNGGSLSGQVILTGKALLLTRDTRTKLSSPLPPVVGTESLDWVGVPLKSRSRTFGALVLQSYSGDVSYTSKDQALLEFVSGQVASAIERKQAEQELKDQNELFQMIQRATNDVICDWDLLTDQAKWNDRVYAVFGYPAEDMIATGTHWWRDRVHPEDRDRVLQSAQEAIERGESVWSAEYRFHRKDGTYATVLDRGYLARDATGKATRLISAMSDLTLRIRAEEAQAANQAKSEFLATMTHELRTPMIGMLGMMEILSHTKLDSEQRSALGTIHSSAQALLGIIGDILDFSKIEAGKLKLEPQVISLRRILEEAFTGTSAVAGDKGLQSKCEIDPGITGAHLADPLRFREIIDNFLSNALKFTRQGSIGLRAELLQTDKESQTLAFRVWDTGIGVSKENQKRLFQPFVQAESTTTRRFGGTGLGLSICLRLAEMMGGGITMESEEGKGTTMSFIAAFPLANPEALEGATQLAASQPMEPPDRETALAAGCLLLLAEDHPTNRLVLTQQLRLSGYQVDTAEDGLAALEALSQTRYGLLLTDIQMPHLDGYQLAKEVRSIEALTGKPRIPILALTANTMQGELDRCLAVGMDDCIIKPVSIPDLDAKLHCWLPGAAKLMKPRAPEAQPENSLDSILPSTSSGSPLDFATLDGLSGGERGSSLDILRDFRDTLRSDMAGLGPLADQGNLPDLARLAHRIKGASAMVGAKPLADAARSLETHAQAGKSHLVAEALAAMESTYAVLERYLDLEIEKG